MVWTSYLVVLLSVVCVKVVPGRCSCDKRGYTLRCINVHLTPHYLSKMVISPNVKEIYLSNNKLSMISAEVLHPFRHARKLGITSNRIRDIQPNTFIEFANLTSLSLKGNAIRELHPDAFTGLSRLQNLNIADNQLAYLYQGIFDHMKGLRSLKLMNNKIRAIPNGVFTRMRLLHDLFMGHNAITRVGDDAFQNMTLNKLDLTYNKIKKISRSTFLNFKIKYKIMLYFNLFECYCDDVMAYARYFGDMYGHIWGNCHTPGNLRDKSILAAYAYTECTLCDLQLCKNGGTCLGNKTAFSCKCTDQYKGKTCENSICKPEVRYLDKVVQLPSVTVLKYSDKKDIPKPNVVFLASKNKELETKLMILYAICSLELVIILCFVGLLILGKYQDWRLMKKYKEEKSRHTLTRFQNHTNIDDSCRGRYTSTPHMINTHDRGKGYTSISQIIPPYKYDCGIR